MKTIGLIGGTSWLSTVEYYRFINKEINKKLGGNNYARCILYSVNQGDIIEFINKDDFEGIYSLILNAVKKLLNSGVDCILLCANTLHMFADRIEKEISVPFIHIGVATANEIKKQNLSKVGLLGTKLTMEENFLKSKLIENNIQVIIPDSIEREYIHNSILNEMMKDVFKSETKNKYKEIIQNLKLQGAEGIVMGCTEIPLLINQNDSDIPLFDTTYIHSLAAVEFAIK